MKNVLKAFGVIALVAVIGFSMAACGGGDDDGGSIPSGLVGKWSLTEWKDTADFEITSSGKLIIDNFIYDISVSGNTITATNAGTTLGMADYSLSNNNTVMTWSNVSGGLFTGLTGIENRFYKIGGNNSGGGDVGVNGSDGWLGNTLTITNAQVYTVERDNDTPQYVKFTGTVPDLKYVDVYTDDNKYGAPLNSIIDGNPSVTLTNGKLNITLGKPKASSLQNLFPNGIPSGVTVSTPNVKLFELRRIYNIHNDMVRQVQYESDQKNYVYYCYVDKTVNITGKYTYTDDDGYTHTGNYAMYLKAGWNSVIRYVFDGDLMKTGTPPAGCRWVVEQ